VLTFLTGQRFYTLIPIALPCCKMKNTLFSIFFGIPSDHFLGYPTITAILF
jgi:hypothetical protein